MKNYVYILLNPTLFGNWTYLNFTFTNQPIYVGIGVDDRINVHFNLNREKYDSNKLKFNTIKELINNNTPPIAIKLFQNINRNDAKKIEIDIIKKFGKLIDNSGFLTNITDGGDETICNILGGKNPHSKAVYQYSLNGDFIKKWECLREIGRELQVTYNTIGDCCREKTKTAYGYQWSYIDKGNKIESIKIREKISQRKPVYRFNYNYELLDTYCSLTSAAEVFNIPKENLSRIILKKQIYNKNYFSYDKIFIPVKKKWSLFYKIKYNNEIFCLTNDEIIEKFKVSKYYISDVKRNRYKNPKFIIVE